MVRPQKMSPKNVDKGGGLWYFLHLNPIENLIRKKIGGINGHY